MDRFLVVIWWIAELEVNINIAGVKCSLLSVGQGDRWGFVGKICHKHSPRIL